MNTQGNRKDRSVRGKTRIQQELRGACSFELLEGRTMMSAAPLAAPTSLIVTTATTTYVDLKWKDNASSAQGYEILRSTDGTHYTLISVVNSPAATTFIDQAVQSGHGYDYKIEAYTGATVSPMSNVATAITPLSTPTAVTANLSGSTINLSWTDNDPAATGYYVIISQDNVNFTMAAKLNGPAVHTFSQTVPAYGTTFYYKVVAFNALVNSAYSASAAVTVPPQNVLVTTRYGDELVVTAAGPDDSISISESGSTLTISADGATFTDAATAGGLFVYTRGGTDTINIAKTVTCDTTLETIDGALTTITNAAADVTAWIDSTDIFTGSGIIHEVAGFAGGISKAVGAALANPTDSGSTITVNASLFGTGPVIGDVNQGEAGDCYFLSSLAAFAQQNPQVLVQSAVDMGDGTYTVQFIANNKPVFVRVSNAFSAGPFEGLKYAHPGADNSIWAMVMEKAFAYFRTGANTYASINSGWMGEAYADLGVSSTGFFPNNFTQASLFNTLSTDLADGQEITLASDQNAPNIVSDHAYTLVSAYKDSNGVAHYVVRNPWGVAGDSLENSQGYATLTYAQLTANFVEGCVS